MPRQANYANMVIYKLVCKDPSITDMYIGHTSNFTKRKYFHKRACENPEASGYNSYVYHFIRATGGWDNWDMVLLEQYRACTSKLDARKREREWFDALKPTLNDIAPHLTKQEEREDGKARSKAFRVLNPHYYEEYRGRKGR